MSPAAAEVRSRKRRCPGLPYAAPLGLRTGGRLRAIPSGPRTGEHLCAIFSGHNPHAIAARPNPRIESMISVVSLSSIAHLFGDFSQLDLSKIRRPSKFLRLSLDKISGEGRLLLDVDSV